ncbi:calcineurin-like phosphoesterase C-terminal domain-containing protein [Sphingobacterium corticibacter]|uniref:Serine/threonine protein phosphatase n=1 Tax=Sphingobacterium corticibacter TaxID=2171749 RepID=A0A2T8HMT9_9SPHI|nr:calcineurin-like phosphoesterase family protein [Sphingobacterium corticibacter]PVH26768.1 serine/threonine protein phosphatase [Sphingobacterium corticibacter]
MIRTVVFCVLLTFLTLSSAIAREVRGKVRTADGQPIAKVAVTDGYDMVLSDDQGVYRLQASPLATFVYITIPAGFAIPIQDHVANFYIPLSPEDDQRSYDFVLDPAGEDSKHAFVVLGDPQVYQEADVQSCATFAQDIREYSNTVLKDKSVHGMIPGDMVGDRPDLFPAVKNVFSSSDLPFFYAKGNHDLATNTRSNTTASNLYEQHFGPRYYAFNRGLIHYVVLDNVFYLGNASEYVGYIDEAQLQWLEKDLKQVPAGSTVVVMLHIPTAQKGFRKVQRGQLLTNRAHLYALLKDYKTHILSGHTHLHDHLQPAPNVCEHNQSSISGIFWQEESCADGTPAGYMVYIADGDCISWKYKTLGQPDSLQGRVYALGENPERPDQITALVWNYDPSWSVSWYEDGQYAGEMRKYVGHDPQTRKDIIKNKSKHAYDWIWTTETDHLFAAKPSKIDAKVMVLIEDGFGNKYEVYVP